MQQLMKIVLGGYLNFFKYCVLRDYFTRNLPFPIYHLLFKNLPFFDNLDETVINNSGVFKIT